MKTSVSSNRFKRMNYEDKTPEIRQRLLEAAGEVFAERGFREATIREICRRAKANVAAINYHFGQKEELYKAVFDYARAYAPRFNEPALSAGSAEQRLRAIVHSLLERFYDGGRPAWLSKLIAREMTDPTNMLDGLVQYQLRPNFERLKAIVIELTGSQVDGESLRLCVFSIAAQWLYYFHCGHAIKRLSPEQHFGPAEIQRLADHITKFTVRALKGWQS